MKSIHLGFLCAMLLGGSELAGKGEFRKIYDEEKDSDRKRERCLNHLLNKEVKAHNPKEESVASELQPSQKLQYYFLEFAKRRFEVPVKEGEERTASAHYSQFKSEMYFMMATEGRGWSSRKASQKMSRLATLLGGLRELKKNQPTVDLSAKAIAAFIDDYMQDIKTQPRMPHLRVKTSTLMAWRIWAKNKSVKGEFREKIESGNAQCALGHLITKMQNVHRLTSAQVFDWDRYLFLKFVGWHITDPTILPVEEQTYRAKRAGLIFVSRLAESSFTKDENIGRQTLIAQEIARLRGVEMPAHFIEDVLYGMTEQYNQARVARENQYSDAKKAILNIWSLWIEKKQECGAEPDPFAGIDSPRDENPDSPIGTHESRGQGQDQQ